MQAVFGESRGGLDRVALVGNGADRDSLVEVIEAGGTLCQNKNNPVVVGCFAACWQVWLPPWASAGRPLLPLPTDIGIARSESAI